MANEQDESSQNQQKKVKKVKKVAKNNNRKIQPKQKSIPKEKYKRKTRISLRTANKKFNYRYSERPMQLHVIKTRYPNFFTFQYNIKNKQNDCEDKDNDKDKISNSKRKQDDLVKNGSDSSIEEPQVLKKRRRLSIIYSDEDTNASTSGDLESIQKMETNIGEKEHQLNDTLEPLSNAGKFQKRRMSKGARKIYDFNENELTPQKLGTTACTSKETQPIKRQSKEIEPQLKAVAKKKTRENGRILKEVLPKNVTGSNEDELQINKLKPTTSDTHGTSENLNKTKKVSSEFKGKKGRPKVALKDLLNKSILDKKKKRQPKQASKKVSSVPGICNSDKEQTNLQKIETHRKGLEGISKFKKKIVINTEVKKNKRPGRRLFTEIQNEENKKEEQSIDLQPGVSSHSQDLVKDIPVNAETLPVTSSNGDPSIPEKGDQNNEQNNLLLGVKKNKRPGRRLFAEIQNEENKKEEQSIDLQPGVSSHSQDLVKNILVNAETLPVTSSNGDPSILEKGDQNNDFVKHVQQNNLVLGVSSLPQDLVKDIPVNAETLLVTTDQNNDFVKHVQQNNLQLGVSSLPRDLVKDIPENAEQLPVTSLNGNPRISEKRDQNNDFVEHVQQNNLQLGVSSLPRDLVKDIPGNAEQLPVTSLNGNPRISETRDQNNDFVEHVQQNNLQLGVSSLPQDLGKDIPINAKTLPVTSSDGNPSIPEKRDQNNDYVEHVQQNNLQLGVLSFPQDLGKDIPVNAKTLPVTSSDGNPSIPEKRNQNNGFVKHVQQNNLQLEVSSLPQDLVKDIPGNAGQLPVTSLNGNSSISEKRNLNNDFVEHVHQQNNTQIMLVKKIDFVRRLSKSFPESFRNKDLDETMHSIFDSNHEDITILNIEDLSKYDFGNNSVPWKHSSLKEIEIEAYQEFEGKLIESEMSTSKNLQSTKILVSKSTPKTQNKRTLKKNNDLDETIIETPSTDLPETSQESVLIEGDNTGKSQLNQYILEHQQITPNRSRINREQTRSAEITIEKLPTNFVETNQNTVLLKGENPQKSPIIGKRSKINEKRTHVNKTKIGKPCTNLSKTNQNSILLEGENSQKSPMIEYRSEINEEQIRSAETTIEKLPTNLVETNQNSVLLKGENPQKSPIIEDRSKINEIRTQVNKTTIEKPSTNLAKTNQNSVLLEGENPQKSPIIEDRSKINKERTHVNKTTIEKPCTNLAKTNQNSVLLKGENPQKSPLIEDRSKINEIRTHVNKTTIEKPSTNLAKTNQNSVLREGENPQKSPIIGDRSKINEKRTHVNKTTIEKPCTNLAKTNQNSILREGENPQKSPIIEDRSKINEKRTQVNKTTIEKPSTNLAKTNQNSVLRVGENPQKSPIIEDRSKNNEKRTHVNLTTIEKPCTNLAKTNQKAVSFKVENPMKSPITENRSKINEKRTHVNITTIEKSCTNLAELYQKAVSFEGKRSKNAPINKNPSEINKKHILNQSINHPTVITFGKTQNIVNTILPKVVTSGTAQNNQNPPELINQLNNSVFEETQNSTTITTQVSKQTQTYVEVMNEHSRNEENNTEVVNPLPISNIESENQTQNITSNRSLETTLKLDPNIIVIDDDPNEIEVKSEIVTADKNPINKPEIIQISSINKKGQYVEINLLIKK